MKKVYDYIIEGILPPSTPHKCECGAELVTNGNLTSVECINPNCKIHNSQKLLDVLKILGITVGIGEKNSQEIIQLLKVANPVEILTVDFSKVKRPGAYYAAIKNLVSEINRIKEDGIYFYKFMNLFFFEFLGRTRCKDLFSNITDPWEFYKKYPDEKSINKYVSERLGIQSFQDTVTVTTKDLIDNKDYILSIADHVKFKKAISGEIFYVTLTGSILYVKDENGNLFSERDEFPEYLSRKYGVNIQPVGFSVKKTRFLIMDSDMSANSKYKKATEHGIPVMNSREFENYIKENYGNDELDFGEEEDLIEDELIENNKINNLTDNEKIDNILNWGD